MYRKLRTITALLIIASFCFLQVPAFAAQAKSMTDTGYLGNDQWIIDSDGDLVPASDSSQDIGASGSEVENLHADSIWMGGVEKTSWGSVISPMTDATGYVATTDGGTKVRLYDVGYIQLGDGTTDNDCYTKYDGADDDWAVGLDTTTDDYTISLGGAFATDNRVAITDDANNTIITIGDAEAGYDQYFVFDGVQDYHIGIDDTGGDGGEDILVIGAGSALNTTTGLAISSTGLVMTAIGLDGIGAVDMDYGSADVTDHTFTTDSTGDGEIVLPDNSIGDAEVDWSGLTTSHGFIIGGTTPLLTVGDGGVEDNAVFFNNSAATEDWAIGVDDTRQKFEICNGANLDATCAVSISNAEDVTIDAGSLYIVDDEYVIFGTSSDWTVEYDEAVDNQLIFLTAGTTATADGDPMFEIITGASMDADQEVFGVSKGTQASNTALFTVDEDGDAVVTGALTVNGTTTTLTSATASKPALNITNTVVGTSGSITTYDKTRGGVDAVDGDDIHTDVYSGYDDGTPTVDNYVSMLVDITDSAVGAEDGSIAWTVVSAGSDLEYLALDGIAGVEINSASANIDTHIDGDSIADLLYIRASTDTINMALNAADSQLLITQTDTTGTSTSPLIYINDDRTGTNANTAGEATLMIDPQGTHAINVVDGLVYCGGAVTLGGAVTDVVTVTGKVAGATPLSFDGVTADAVYTILAVADAASASKTVTLPSITSTIALETAATTTITADTTATITVNAGTDTLYTYTIDTDNEDCTLTFSAGGTAGDIATIIFITDGAGSADEVMTFHGTLSDTEGTLTLATGASKRYVITFISDGTIWNEVSRTAVLG